MDRVDRGLVLPALAGHLAGDGRALFGNRAGQFLGQIKITPDAFFVGTSEAEHGLGVLEVDHVVELTVRGETFGVVIPEVDDQRLQLPKFVRETGRGFDALPLLIAVFGPQTYSLSIHNMATFQIELSGNRTSTDKWRVEERTRQLAATHLTVQGTPNRQNSN